MPTKHAVIVGGSSGIGLAAAHSLLEQDLEVTITGRDRDRLDNAGRALNGRAKLLAVDAADSAEMQSAFARIGNFDHLILAFGSRKGMGPLASIDLREVRQSFEEKVFPHIACAQAALPFLSQNGSIIFVSAVSGHAAMPGTAGIGAANAAIAALVPILAVELRPLRVNGVSPGVIETPWWDFLPEAQRSAAFADFAAKTPVGRIGRPEDVAEAIAFLVRDDFMTGQTIICDGGVRLAAA